MRLEQMVPGDVLMAYHDSGCMGAQPIYAQVVRVNRVTVTVRDERGDVSRVLPAAFHRKLAAHDWRPESVGGPKPCPMDGDEAEWHDVGGALRWTVRCCKCGVTTRPFATPALALDNWNRRKS